MDLFVSGHHESENVPSSPTSTNNNQSKSSELSTTLEFSQTPQKYRRQPLTQDEIDLVTVRNLFIPHYLQSAALLLQIGGFT